MASTQKYDNQWNRNLIANDWTRLRATMPTTFTMLTIIIKSIENRRLKKVENAVLTNMSSYSHMEATTGLVIPTREPLVASELT